MSPWTDILPPILDFLRHFLPCRTLLAFKLRGLYIVVPSILADIGLRVFVWKRGLAFELVGTEIAVAIAVILLFAFLVTVDAVLKAREQKFRNQLMALLADPNVPDFVKQEITHQLFL
jgi:hypothetical protein